MIEGVIALVGLIVVALLVLAFIVSQLVRARRIPGVPKREEPAHLEGGRPR